MKIESNKVYLIAGHNGKGTGASSKWLDEGSETVVFRDLIGLNLTRLGFFDYVLDDGTLGIGDNAKLSSVVTFMKQNANESALSIDLHFNAFGDQTANGSEVLVPFNATALENKFANDLLSEVCTTLGVSSRGVKCEGSGHHSKLAMLSGGGISGTNVLLEVCFCTNENDCKKYFSNREELAFRIATLIVGYMK